MSTENTGSVAPAQQAAAPETENSQLENSELGSEDLGADAGGEAAVAEAAAVITDPNATKAEKVAAKKMLKSLKIKVDGKEYEEALPFEIEDDPKIVEWMQRNLQLSKVSSKRMQEKAESEQEIRDFIEQLKNDPEAILSNPLIGVDLKKFATKIIEQEIENEKKSPAELELEKTKRELKAMKEAQEREKEENKAREMERIQQEAYDRYDTMIDQAFQKYPNVPKSPYFVKRISEYMLLGLKNGMDVNPEDVLPLVIEESKKDFKDLIGSSNDDLVEEFLGKDRINSFRKKAIAKAKANAVAPKVQDTGGKSMETKAPEKRMTIKDRFKV